MSDLLLVFILILANGFLSFSEMAIISSRKSRLSELVQEKRKGAKTALALAENPTGFLSAIQVGITAVSTLAGAFGGVAVADDLAKFIKTVELLAPHADTLALGSIVFLISFVSLVVGELVPKQIALSNPEGLACLIAPPLASFSKLVSPAVNILSFTSNTLMRIVGVKQIEAPPVTETEIKLIIEQATKAQIVLAVEQDLVEAVLRLADRRITAIMTPRTDIEWLSVDASQQEILETIASHPFSRLIVCKETPDDFIGVLDTREALVTVARGERLDLEKDVIDVLKIPEKKTILELLQLFKQTGEQFAAVISEWGGLQGIVTIHDILQSIVGVVPEPGQDARWEVHQREDGSWLLDGLMPVDAFKDLLGLEAVPGEGGEYETLAGLVLFQCRHLPETGELFVWEGYKFEVVDMDGQRVDKILVTPPQKPADDKANGEEEE